MTERIKRIAERLCFERVGGTAGEARAAKIIKDLLEEAGLAPRAEDFTIKKARILEARLWVDGQEIPCTPYELTGPGEVEADLVFIRDPENPEQDVRGKMVLINGLMRGKFYGALQGRGAVGFISVRSPKGEIRGPRLSSEAYEEFGDMPGVMVDYEVGLALLNARRARLVKQEEVEDVPSRNLIAELGRGQDETVVFTAHYDSVPGSPGALDNLGGTIALLLLAEHLAGQRLQRGARLVFCGSEERGLLGSKAYVKDHEAELERVLWVINLDVLGDALGRDFCRVLGSREALFYVEHLAKEMGFPLKAEQGIYSSDGMPFARRGIPSFSLGSGGAGTFYGHTPKDDLTNFSAEALGFSVGFIKALAGRLLTAKRFPLAREIPVDLREKVAEYFEVRTGKKEVRS